MDNLQKWLEPVLEENGCTLYEIEWDTSMNPPILRISIDKVGGVDLDTCAQCSDAIGTMLDGKDWYAKEYMLEVCSPGAEKELKTDEQIEQAIGSYVFVKLKDPKQGLDSVRGDLMAADENTVTVKYRDKSRLKTIVVDKSNISLIMTAVKL